MLGQLCTKVELPSLTRVGGDFWVYDNDKVETVSAPLLETVTGEVYLGLEGSNSSQSITHDNIAPPVYFQNGAKSGFEMCFGSSTLGAEAKTRLESRIKKFAPHCACRPVHQRD